MPATENILHMRPIECQPLRIFFICDQEVSDEGGSQTGKGDALSGLLNVVSSGLATHEFAHHWRQKAAAKWIQKTRKHMQVMPSA
jgi:hypothetical protein